TETQPLGLLDGKDTQGTPGTGTTVNDAFQNIPLTAGTLGADNNFGELRPSSISGRVFLDNNNDGSDAGDPGLPSVTVTLTGVDDLGNTVTITATTAPDGTYSFDNLRPGVYTVVESQPAGFLDGKDTLGSVSGGAPGALPGVLGNDRADSITLTENTTG